MKAKAFDDALNYQKKRMLERDYYRMTDEQVAAVVGVNRRTITRWRQRPEWQAGEQEAREQGKKQVEAYMNSLLEETGEMVRRMMTRESDLPPKKHR